MKKEEEFKKLWNELNDENKQIAFNQLLKYIEEEKRKEVKE